jgi:type I restriction enzyme S subunit
LRESEESLHEKNEAVPLNVLLSIKPNYAHKIFDGEKKYEFRRRIFRRDNIERIFIYSTSPICKITGNARIERITEGKKEEIWEKCFLYSGMAKNDFFDYFEGVKIGFAIELKNVTRFAEPIDPYEMFNDFTPPQSFCYLEGDITFP